jgi:hypothetical protein
VLDCRHVRFDTKGTVEDGGVSFVSRLKVKTIPHGLTKREAKMCSCARITTPITVPTFTKHKKEC